MSYYFVIVGTQDNPLFEHEFGTSKQGGDGVARFPDRARHMNQLIVHSSLDTVEEVQWASGQLYLKHIDRFYNSYISCFLTPSSHKFLLLHAPPTPLGGGAGGGGAGGGSASLSSSAATITPGGSAAAAAAAASAARSSGSSIASNPMSAQTEEAVRLFFAEVWENWVKAVMNPFYTVGMELRSPLFRGKVAAAGKKYL